jgi:hypothetical protein
MEFIDRSKAIVLGSTIYIRIPAPTCQNIGIVKGTPLNVYRDGNKIVYERVIE